MPPHSVRTWPLDKPPPADATAAERARHFADWLVPYMEEHRISNGALVKLINRTGYDSGTIANWRKGRYAPSETGAILVAKALRLPIPRVLRHAGHWERAADFEEAAAHGVQPAPRDPVYDLLEQVGDPALTAPLAAEYEREMAAARRRIELEIAELRRRLGRPGSQDDETGQVI